MRTLTHFHALPLVFAFASVTACSGSEEHSDDNATTYDSELLAEYRTALPDEARLQATVPGGDATE